MGLIFSLWITLSAAAHSATWSPIALYGEDDRREGAPSQALASPVAVGITARRLQGQPLPWVNAPSAALRYDLCPGEAFDDQPSLGACTGILVAPDLILTAGHCVESRAHCENLSWYFDYTLERTQGLRVELGEGSACAEVLERDRRLDVALVRLRERQARAPQPVSAESATPSQVFLLGHPLGLPLKTTGPAAVTMYADDDWRASIDAFEGNSGSPVFSMEGQLVGVFVSGETDFVPDYVRGCNASARFPLAGGSLGGEHFVPVSALPERFHRRISRHLR